MARKSASLSSRPWVFFGLTFLHTWIFWIPAVFLSRGEYTAPARILHYAGGLMPTATALYLLYVFGERDDKPDYWRRIIDFTRIGVVWYAIIFLSVPALTVFGGFLDKSLGGPGANLESLAAYTIQPLAILPFALFILIFGPLPEEMAWRGYALDGLQARNSALSASLILGLAWAAWHLPLFGIQGSYQNGLGIGTARFWLYMLNFIPHTILMTWIYNHTGRSTLSAILYHFMINFTGELIDLSLRAEAFYIAGLWTFALIVVIFWFQGRQSRNRVLSI
jgi:membrane protease YdiL (CAAX protease family)